ncbi:type VII secretion-associated serine protease mycosin [Amycolatopsis sp. EV170708-02-1]|uniref:type VII secretion-associated serine protease mycosin n=1 Tax=Amycolatopsis sp. EV170708-02-1 TaxID=2919322 RepID=UPI001F0C6F87|nr:type VII secretion-associated serine protease mycosin [Amycolatopsis sp. EV170708-02-1]UMP06932.1 type VII secretion-associated serine protease mycosin [Amycolatopsis sp. EV170708-02-1]
MPPPNGADASIPWAQQQLAPQRVWPLTKGGGVVVGVVDTGVDASTPQLAGGKVLPGFDVTAAAGRPADDDCVGHGTFLAGIIGASPASDTGFAGVAPDVTILPVRVASSLVEGAPGALNPAAIGRGIRTAVDSGARVINVSASTSVPDKELASAVAYAAERDVVVVASAGNGAKDGDPATYPASYPTVIAVGAVDSAGQQAPFSPTGSHVSLVAPGVDVTSVGPGGPGQWQGSGTSYAAPFVTGTAALVRAYHPGLTAPQVKRRLETTANHPATALPDPTLGWGTVNPLAAVTAVVPEEGANGQPVLVGPPAARAADITPPDEVGPILVTVAVLGVIGTAFVLVWVCRLCGAGNRRGWGPSRVMRVVSHNPTPKERRDAPARGKSA